MHDKAAKSGREYLFRTCTTASDRATYAFYFAPHTNPHINGKKDPSGRHAVFDGNIYDKLLQIYQEHALKCSLLMHLRIHC